MSVYVLDGVDAGENKKHRCIKFISLKGDVIRNIAFLLALWEYNLINIVERMSVEKKNAYIGVDLGGTNMRAGRIVGDRLVAQGSAPTPKDAADCEETLEALIEVIRSVWDESVVAIGIGVPSVVDREKGIVYNVVNIPHWEEVHLKEILEACFSVPVYVDNDANCFALGERIFGEGKTVDNFVGLTLGTGLGVELSRMASCWPTLIVARENLA